ncbi:unnamed protein product [marine sediment metagenome]|uniref:Uncharacterized protein n=1 Tax=marine sediment metagenome TaxID=412755 RepID=X1SL77_9ZZZZ
MEWNDNENKIIEKAKFYKANEIKAHVLTIPKGTWKDGLFVSDLEDNKFFWFIEDGESIAVRLFLFEIYDIEDYNKDKESSIGNGGVGG